MRRGAFFRAGLFANFLFAAFFFAPFFGPFLATFLTALVAALRRPGAVFFGTFRCAFFLTAGFGLAAGAASAASSLRVMSSTSPWAWMVRSNPCAR